ncbi:oxygenase MpaB family protein [Streptomyces sp. NPDC059786]|uniref:oxygenase MpaB family protein n=1 Tax=Streptomyces sp. NPDC059786 TaxID=3346946 RepID=UPI00365A963A
MGRYSRLRRIERLDPRQDYEQIFRWLTQYEFPWDYTQGVSVAFLRDYGVPRISQLRDRTQEFERAGQKRYDDTVPVLATTVVGPKRWIDRYGWRRLSAAETESLALVGRRMGELMGITGLPADYAVFEQLHDAYEKEMFAYDPANRRVAAATLRVVTGWYPRPLRPHAARASLAVLDEPLLTALGLPEQPRRLRTAVHRALRARAALVRALPPRPDRWPHRPKPRTYPFGWALDDLGPHWAHGRPLEPLTEEVPNPAPDPASS